LDYFLAILVYISRFGMLSQEKSGNPGLLPVIISWSSADHQLVIS
jgi:hypothetical protein